MTEKMETARRYHEQDYEAARKVGEIATGVGQVVIKSIFIINGGVSIALLAFIGSIAPKEDKSINIDVSRILDSLNWFSSGVSASVFAMMLVSGSK